MANRPTPQQLLIRRLVALVIVIVLGIGVIKVTSSVFSFITDSFASNPEETIAPTQTEANNKGNLQKCSDDDISVLVGFEGKTSFTSEEVIVIDATFTYKGSSSCLRDIGARANEIYVVNEKNKKVWSTNTCPVNNKSNLVEMNPGNTYRTTITWGGNVDPKVCGKDAKHLPPGEYGIYARNGGAISERTTITFE
jgi:hypothetical protein